MEPQKMSLREQRTLEVELDRMIMSNQADVVTVAREGQELMKARKYTLAKAKYDEAALHYLKPISLMDAMTAMGLAASKAEARRVIKAGGVWVDGKRERRHEKNIASAKTLKVGKKEVQL